MAPLFDILFPYLPEKILKPLRFGVRYDLIKHLESDVVHTAKELQTKDVDNYFDIEIVEKELSLSDSKSNANNGIRINEKYNKYDDDNVDSCSSGVESYNGTNGSISASSTCMMNETKMHTKL
ncbi:hypothetical protein CHS0354_013052 [Potamilus streckersoni]|uniref:Uncharacterized protein n=1 Tax=Potamilus streckersoni TaxID=2493646 RepID=A0AAE0RZX1_9BIVA|nr:hypothetical protein CHS0354_013052 [Potamilus streckersoni]